MPAIDSRARTEARRARGALVFEGMRLYSLTELEEILGLSHRTLRTYVKNGTLHAILVGGKYRVTETNVKHFLNGEPQDKGPIV